MSEFFEKIGCGCHFLRKLGVGVRAVSGKLQIWKKWAVAAGIFFKKKMGVRAMS